MNPYKIMAKITKLPPIAYIALALLLFTGYWWSKAHLNLFSAASLSKTLDKNLSRGESLLITANANQSKTEGIKAFAKGDFTLAQRYFQDALKQAPNEPDTRIYFWNAQVQSEPHLTIAVSVPIGSNLSVAQEILRGVAQAQHEINSQGGIRGQKLAVIIADDQNNPTLATTVANALVQQSEVLGVVGHNASDASLAAAAVYQKAGLVMVSPTSSGSALSGFGGYIFRTVPSARFMADHLSSYVVKTAQKKRVAVCADFQSIDNLSFGNEFTASATTQGTTVVNINCDLASTNLNAEVLVSDMQKEGVEGILLSPHIDRIDQALKIARAAQGKLPIWSSPTLYTFKTLRDGQQAVAGLVLPVPTVASEEFLKRAKQLWGGEVKTWRTALAYDATRAIITGLEHSTSRSGLQQALKDPKFTAGGSGRPVSFLPTGDRAGLLTLIQVKATATGYEFIPIGQ
jgi:branched-chain amino acid transport system substrate-binding protein